MDDPTVLESAVSDRATSVQPRVLVALLLIAGAILWAATRGLAFYGFGPVTLGYDLDQPPVLILIVGAWLLYRTRPPARPARQR
jgi:uncharacterized BrkB/YihY/UPF0761 family membrane protein